MLCPLPYPGRIRYHRCWQLASDVLRLIETIFRLPPLKIQLGTPRTLRVPFIATVYALDLVRHERGQLETLQVGHDICPHFRVVNDVSTVLCVPTHAAGSVALVEALVDILCRQGQLAPVLEEGRRGLHRERGMSVVR